MRKRLVAVGLGAILGANSASAQPPQYPVSPAFPVAPPSYPPVQIPIAPARPLPPTFPVAPPVSMQPQYPAPGYPIAPTFPGPRTPSQPPQALPPALLPPGVLPTPQPTVKPGANPLLPPGAETPLPYAEQKFSVSAMDVSVKRVIGGWQVWAGQRMMRDLGDNETNARDVARVFRDLRPTEWVTIGGARPVVEYGLTNGRPAVAGMAMNTDSKAGNAPAPGAGPSGGLSQLPVVSVTSSGPAITGAGAKIVQPIDLRTARVEPIRGVWCVRDDSNLLFNFGTDKAGAEQTIAAIRKYGFNRVGVVGTPSQPAMSYLFVSLEAEPKQVLGGPLLLNAQIEALTRTGIPVPGVGFTGEMVKIDPRKVTARKDGAEWVVASGSEVLGHFGPTEWPAREAARTVQNAKFTEFCRLSGASGVTFFLTDGKAPTRAPFSAQGRNFNVTGLKVQQINNKWAVTESNRHLFDVGSPQEGETLIRVLQSYGFDQTARLGSGSPKGGIMFLVKNR